MKRFLTLLPVAAVLLPAAAIADDVRCNVPAAERQPEQALKAKLEAAGMTVKRIKTEDGCYEAYAIDKDGKRVEAYFDPRTLDRLAGKKDS